MLLKAAIDAVPTVPDDLDEKEATKKTTRIFVNNLGSMGRSIAECKSTARVQAKDDLKDAECHEAACGLRLTLKQ